MDLRELRVALRRNWFIGLLAFVICLLPGIAAGILPEKEYTSKSRLAVQTPITATSNGAVQTATFLIPGVVATIESRSLKDRAAQDVPENLRNLWVGISASATDSVIDVSGTGRSPAAVQAWVNAVTGLAVEENDPASPLQLSLVDEAVVPTKASSPKPVPILVGAGLLGLIAAVFAAVAASRLRTSFDRGRTVRQRLGTTVLGEVPVIRDLGSERRAILPWLASNPPAELVEAFQAIRTNVEFRLADLGARTVVVTSYQASAGKSTLATGLAWSLAAVGRDTLLLDADLRRPTLHEKLGTDPGAGLADMVNADPASFVQTTTVANLTFVPAGLPSGRPADIVSRALPRALERLDNGERLIIIDSPPIEGVAETPLVVSAGKYVILVLDGKSVELPELGEAVFRLQDSGAVILGVVINRVSRRAFKKKTAYYGHTRVASSGRSRGGLRSRRPSHAPQPVHAAVPPPPPAPPNGAPGNLRRRRPAN